jgi:hypothetical protein
MNNGCDQVGVAGGLCPLKHCCLALSKKKGDAGESIAFVVHVMKLLTIE